MHTWLVLHVQSYSHIYVHIIYILVRAPLVMVLGSDLAPELLGLLLLLSGVLSVASTSVFLAGVYNVLCY